MSTSMKKPAYSAWRPPTRAAAATSRGLSSVSGMRKMHLFHRSPYHSFANREVAWTDWWIMTILTKACVGACLNCWAHQGF